MSAPTAKCNRYPRTRAAIGGFNQHDFTRPAHTGLPARTAERQFGACGLPMAIYPALLRPPTCPFAAYAADSSRPKKRVEPNPRDLLAASRLFRSPPCESGTAPLTFPFCKFGTGQAREPKLPTLDRCYTAPDARDATRSCPPQGLCKRGFVEGDR